VGYDTEFTGQVAIVPPLNPREVEYLDRFAETRHESRDIGPYAVNGNGLAPGEMYGGKQPGAEHPGFWCQWVPTASGDALIWNGEEKFYHAEKWLAYLVETFLATGAEIRGDVPAKWFRPSVFDHFTCDHVLNGVVTADGEEEDDRWRMEVRDNVVHVVRLVEWPEYAEIDPRNPGEWGSGQWDEYVARARRNHVYTVSGAGEIHELGPAAENGFEPVSDRVA
jgi:hypothetical protein